MVRLVCPNGHAWEVVDLVARRGGLRCPTCGAATTSDEAPPAPADTMPTAPVADRNRGTTPPPDPAETIPTTAPQPAAEAPADTVLENGPRRPAATVDFDFPAPEPTQFEGATNLDAPSDGTDDGDTVEEHAPVDLRDEHTHVEFDARTGQPKRPPTVGSGQSLVDRLLALGVLSPKEVEELTVVLESGDLPVDAVGHELVRRGVVTEYQVQAAQRSDGAPLVLGDYVVERPLGAGGMGHVYVARHRRLGRPVALKVISPRLAADPELLERFENEARATARLHHDNIVTVHDFESAGGVTFFTMQLVDGPSLSELLKENPLDSRRAATYLEPVARAVEAAHAEGILHRDIKPSNVLVEKSSDRPLVADFGLAKSADADSQLTRTGDVIGTPSYMSPEQARGVGTLTPASDVYSLGATLYCSLIGRPPLQAASVAETLRLVMDQEPVPPRRINPVIDRDLETICLKCLEKEPERRFATAGELADELSRFLRGEPIHSRPIGRPERVWRWCRRNPGTSALLASTVLAAVVAFVSVVVAYANVSAAKARTEAAKVRTDAAYAHARRTVDEFSTTVSEDVLLDQPGMKPLREKLLRRALDYYKQLLADSGNDPDLEGEIGDVHFKVGHILEEIEGPEAALLQYGIALDIQEQRAEEDPTFENRAAVATTQNAIGGALGKSGEWKASAEAYERALAQRRALAAEEPKHREVRRQLANTLMNLGIVASRLGSADEAESAARMEEAQTMRTELLAEDPNDDDVRRDLAKGAFNLGSHFERAGKPDEAADAYRNAVEGFAIVVGRNRRDLSNRYRLAVSRHRLANLTADADVAEREFTAAVDELEELVRENDDYAYRVELARCLYDRGVRDRDGGRPVDGVHLGRSVELFRALDEDGFDYRYEFALALFEAGLADAMSAETSERAAIRFETAAKYLSQLLDADPGDDEVRKQLERVRAEIEKLKSI